MGKDHSAALVNAVLADAVRWTKEFIPKYRSRSRNDTTLTQDEVKYIYGIKGGVRKCAALDQRTRGFLTSYSKFWDIAIFVKTNYQKLKIETLAKNVAGVKDCHYQHPCFCEYAKEDLRSYGKALWDVIELNNTGALKAERWDNLLRRVKEREKWIKESRFAHTGKKPEPVEYVCGDCCDKYYNWSKKVEMQRYKEFERQVYNLRHPKPSEETERAIAKGESDIMGRPDIYKRLADKMAREKPGIPDFYEKVPTSLRGFRIACGEKAAGYLKNQNRTIEKIIKGKYKTADTKCKVEKIFFAGLVALVSCNDTYSKVGDDAIKKTWNFVLK